MNRSRARTVRRRPLPSRVASSEAELQAAAFPSLPSPSLSRVQYPAAAIFAPSPVLLRFSPILPDRLNQMRRIDSRCS